MVPSSIYTFTLLMAVLKIILSLIRCAYDTASWLGEQLEHSCMHARLAFQSDPY